MGNGLIQTDVATTTAIKKVDARIISRMVSDASL
jgi:hypothetical protein